uniref:Nucleolar protein 16 n=1 Tax=Heterorhabditis bacteriophora TaxID=37862 RepID=A0A1I7WNZ7_HETBA
MPLKKKKASVKPKRANTLSSKKKQKNPSNVKKHEMVTVEESGKDFLRPITDRSQWEFEENDTQLITKSVAGYVEKLKKGSLKGIRDEFRRNKSYIPEGRKEACVENETKTDIKMFYY